MQSGTETDIDCGGECALCSEGAGWLVAGDCASGFCGEGACRDCETHDDCGEVAQSYCDGGQCAPRQPSGESCETGEECSTSLCVGDLCCDDDFDGSNDCEFQTSYVLVPPPTGAGTDPAADPAYPDTSGNELMDGSTVPGTDWVSCAGWLDVEGATPNPEVKVDLGVPRNLSSFAVYAANSSGVGEFAIYRPSSAEVLVSADDIDYTSIGFMSWAPFSDIGDKLQMDEGSLEVAVRSRYVKLVLGFGEDVNMNGGSWVILSEVCVGPCGLGAAP